MTSLKKKRLQNKNQIHRKIKSPKRNANSTVVSKRAELSVPPFLLYIFTIQILSIQKGSKP